MAPAIPDPRTKELGERVAGAVVDLRAWKARKQEEAREAQRKQHEEQSPARKIEEARARLLVADGKLKEAEKMLTGKVQQASASEAALSKARKMEEEWVQSLERRTGRFASYERKIAEWKKAHPFRVRMGMTQELEELEAKRTKASEQVGEAQRESQKWRRNINELRHQHKQHEAGMTEAAQAVQLWQQERKDAEQRLRCQLPKQPGQPQQPRPNADLEERRKLREMMQPAWSGPKPPSPSPSRPGRSRGWSR